MLLSVGGDDDAVHGDPEVVGHFRELGKRGLRLETLTSG